MVAPATSPVSAGETPCVPNLCVWAVIPRHLGHGWTVVCQGSQACGADCSIGGQGDCHLCGPGLLLLGHLGQGDVGWEIFHVGRECMPTSVFFKGPRVFRMLSVSYGCVCVLCV